MSSKGVRPSLISIYEVFSKLPVSNVDLFLNGVEQALTSRSAFELKPRYESLVKALLPFHRNRILNQQTVSLKWLLSKRSFTTLRYLLPIHLRSIGTHFSINKAWKVAEVSPSLLSRTSPHSAEVDRQP